METVCALMMFISVLTHLAGVMLSHA